MNHRTVFRNKALHLTCTLLRTVALLCASGTLMQTFLSSLGFSAAQVYLHTSVLQAVNILVMLLGSRWVEVNNAIRRYALICIPCGLLFLAYLPLCFREGTTETFILLVGISVVQGVTVGLRTIGEYTIPYLLFPAEDYGPFIALTGVVSSIFTILLGIAVSALVEHVPFVTLMVVAFTVSALLILLEALLCILQRSILTPEEMLGSRKSERDHLPLSATLCHPAFYTLLLPSYLRGISSGATMTLAALGFSLGFDESVTAHLVLLQSLATLSACTLVGLLARRVSARYTILLGSLTFLLYPLVFSGSGAVFLAVCTAIVFGKTFVDYGVPQMLRVAVPAELAGTYNSWRLTVQTLGQLSATAIAAAVRPSTLVTIALVTAVTSGCGYFFSRVLKEADPLSHRS